jgi:hypothetical protein
MAASNAFTASAGGPGGGGGGSPGCRSPAVADLPGVFDVRWGGRGFRSVVPRRGRGRLGIKGLQCGGEKRRDVSKSDDRGQATYELCLLAKILFFFIIFATALDGRASAVAVRVTDAGSSKPAALVKRPNTSIIVATS